MDAVTYPHAGVRQELDLHWLDDHIDVTKVQDVAALFGVVAIPTAVAITADGTVLGTVQGFATPESFCKQLEALRGKR